MIKEILLIKFLFILSICLCQQGSRSNSMSNCSVALIDCWAFNNNPGALGLIDKKIIGISHENRFLLKEFQSQAVVCCLPSKNGVFSFGSQFHGIDVYKTLKIGVGYSLKFTDKLYAGIEMNYTRIKFTSFYGSKNLLTAEAGIYCIITNKWKVGCSIFNIGRSRISIIENERFSSFIKIGSVFELSKKVMFAIEVDKNIFYKIQFKGAIEYKISKDFFFRSGISNQPLEYSFGFGYKLKCFQMDLGSSYHQIIGWSPNFSISCSIE